MPDVDFDFDAAGGGHGGLETDVIGGRSSRPGRPGRPGRPVRPGRSSRSAAILAGAAILGCAVVLVVHGRHVTPKSAPPSVTPSAAPSTTVWPGQLALAQLVLQAETSDNLHDDLAGDIGVICPQVVAEQATQAAMTVVAAKLPGYFLVDGAVTRGARGTVCGLQVRARDDFGATILVTVLAPPEADSSAFNVSRGTDRSTVLDVEVIVDSWSVQVGWVGPTGAGPTSVDLESVARDRRLTW